MVRFLCMSEISINVDLNEYAIGYPPNKSLTASCRKQPSIERLFSTTESPTSESNPDFKATAKPSEMRISSYGELFQLADCFSVKELRDYCRDRIILPLELANALEVLFSFAYRYSDLKDAALLIVAKNMDAMYSNDSDPLEYYADHQQRYTLLAEALRYRLMKLHR